MRLIIRLLGVDVFELSTDSPAYEADEPDCSRDLSGGNLGAYHIDAGPTDRYMGFTSGLEYGDE